MRLKRGMERESCDFCHQRKTKCDRLSRRSLGHAACSQCALRQETCSLDDSDDIRIRSRRRRNSRGHIADTDLVSPQGLGTHKDGARWAGNAARAVSGLTGHDATPDHRQPSLEEYPSVAQPLSTFANCTGSQETGAETPFMNDHLRLDTPFELSPESILFLDNIFMAGGQSPVWVDERSIERDQHSTSATINGSPSDQTHEHGPGRQQPWLACGVESATFISALEAYFNSAALCLPIIFQDAFWQDYHAGRCSQTIIFAVACRGVPFTSVPDKWDVQQRLASAFKEAFCDAQHKTHNQGSMGLDELEALALMVNFTYDEAYSSPLQSRLESLFLTHDSLVLMTLQSRIHHRSSPEPDISSRLAKATERRTLLFWHVYGLDAFYCLDQKRISRIPDSDVDHTKSLPRHEARSYLDAILALAIIARRTMQTLCTATTGRNGIKYSDILSLYELLDQWRTRDCPSQLRRHNDSAGQLSSIYKEVVPAASPEDNNIQLHRATVWLMEVNCYMQIESCATEYGIVNGLNVEAEMAAMRVEYETLRAIRDTVSISQWITLQQVHVPNIGGHSLIDLAPSILRDTCAGVCTWTCLRGVEVARRGSSSMIRCSNPLNQQINRDNAAALRKTPASNYMTTAALLRDAVATATSHSDTEMVLNRLNSYLASLEESVVS